jgi:hypothetical protein
MTTNVSAPDVDEVTLRRRHDGPPLGPVSIVVLGLTLVGILLPAAIAGRFYPSPLGPAAAVAGYFSSHAFAATLTGLFAFGAAIPLAIFSASASVRLNRLGVRVPGPTIALTGGLLASASLAASGLVSWVLGRPELASGDRALVRALHDIGFALGGPGFVVPLGLLLAGIAVPALIVRLVPRWLGWAGLVLAAACEVATLTLLWDGFTTLLPLGRFLGLAWLIAVGFLLPHDRREVARRDERTTTHEPPPV